MGPVIVCAGSDVTVEWDLGELRPSGRLILETGGSTRDVPIDERVGSRTFTVDRDTTFRLEVDELPDCDEFTRSVQVIPDGSTREFTFVAEGRCPQMGGGRPYWGFNIFPEDVDTRTRIVSVTNPPANGDRALRVEKRPGGAAEIGPGRDDDGQLEGLSAVGQWSVLPRPTEVDWLTACPFRFPDDVRAEPPAVPDVPSFAVVFELECE